MSSKIQYLSEELFKPDFELQSDLAAGPFVVNPVKTGSPTKANSDGAAVEDSPPMGE